MTLLVCILIGGAIGWAGLAWLAMNDARSTTAAVLIGAAGGFVGGQFVAPAIGASAIVSGDVGIGAMVVAALCAVASVIAGNFAQDHIGL